MHSCNSQIRLMHAVRASVKMVAPSSARFSVSKLFYSFAILFRESFKETQKKVGRAIFLANQASLKNVLCNLQRCKRCYAFYNYIMFYTCIVHFVIFIPYKVEEYFKYNDIFIKRRRLLIHRKSLKQ